MRAALVLVLAALLGAPAVAGAVAATPPPAASAPTATDEPTEPGPTEESDPGLPLEVDVEAITPVLTPGADLSLTGTVHNRGDTAIGTPRVVVRLDRSVAVTRSALDAWREADPDGRVGTELLTVDLVGPLAPGASIPFSVTVPSPSVGLRTSAAWGPRGVAVEVVDRDDSARRRQGLARTFTVWFPPQDVVPTRVSVLVPVVGPAVDPHAAPTSSGLTPSQAELDALTRPGGRLADLLTATAASSAVTWAVDPGLVAQAAASDSAGGAGGVGGAAEAGTGTESAGGTVPAAGGTTPAPAPTTTAAAWAATFLTVARSHEVTLLPYGDADVAALAHAGSAGPWNVALGRAAETAVALGLPAGASSSLVLPAGDAPDLTTAAFGSVGGRTVVTGPGALPVDEELTYTPGARATVTAPGGDVTVLVPDARLSAALATGDVGGGGRDAQLTPATAAQDVLAELAVITRERPSDSRHLLVTVPRSWDADPTVAATQLAALGGAPWIAPAPVQELVAGTPAPEADVEGEGDESADDAAEGDGHTDTLPRDEPADAEIRPGEIAALEATLALRSRLAAAAERPDELVGDPTAELLAPLSVAWRADPAGRAAVLAASAARTESLRDAVVVQTGGLLLVSTSAMLPLLVENTLDQPVTVEITLRPSDRRLIADDPVTVTLPALGQEQVLLPVHAVQSADVRVTVELRGPDGVLLDDRTRLTVRVRAEWEGIGAAIIGGLLAVGLVLGIVRTIRRGRTASRAAPVAAGPDALSPEEAEEEAEEAGEDPAQPAGARSDEVTTP